MQYTIFIKSIKHHSWNKYLGPKTEFAGSNISQKELHLTHSKNYVAQTFSDGFTDVNGDKNI